MSLRNIFEAVKKMKKIAEVSDVEPDAELDKTAPKKAIVKPVPKKELPKPEKKEPEMTKGEILGKHFDALNDRKHAKAKLIVTKAAEEHGEKFALAMEKHNKDFFSGEKK